MIPILKHIFQKTIFIFLIIIFSTSITFSKNVEGTITLQNDSIEKVIFVIPTYFASKKIDIFEIQKGIYCFRNNRKELLKPTFIKGFRFQYDSICYEFISFKNNLGGLLDPKYLFLQIKSTGRLCEYDYYYWKNSFDGKSYIDRASALKLENGELFVPIWFNDFIYYMKQYLKDCPSVIEKIENRIYTAYDLDKIIEEYNSCK